MAKTTKEIKKMCGSCYNDFPSEQIKMVTLHVNPGVEKNGRYMRDLCDECRETDYYIDRILDVQTPRKLN